MIHYGNRKRECCLNNLRDDLEDFQEEWEISDLQLQDLILEIIEEKDDDEDDEKCIRAECMDEIKKCIKLLSEKISKNEKNN